MLKKDKATIDDFKLKARPVDQVNFIQQQEIIILLKEIKKLLNKGD